MFSLILSFTLSYSLSFFLSLSLSSHTLLSSVPRKKIQNYFRPRNHYGHFPEFGGLCEVRLFWAGIGGRNKNPGWQSFCPPWYSPNQTRNPPSHATLVSLTTSATMLTRHVYTWKGIFPTRKNQGRSSHRGDRTAKARCRSRGLRKYWKEDTAQIDHCRTKSPTRRAAKLLSHHAVIKANRMLLRLGSEHKSSQLRLINVSQRR